MLAAQQLSSFPVDAIVKFVENGVDALVERAFHARGLVLRSEELQGAAAYCESIDIIRGLNLTDDGVSFGYSRIPMRRLAYDATIGSYAGFMPACRSLEGRTR
jgi:hypothetical protein